MNIVKDVFIVKEIDMIPLDPSRPSVKTKNKIFPKVSRIYAVSENKKLEFILDINTDIYKISSGDHLDFLITQPFLKNSVPLKLEDPSLEWSQYLNKDLIAEYEYVMYGVIFHSGIEKDNYFFYASFGGLLLKLFGTLENVSEKSLKTDLNILLLIKKRLKDDF
mmetsp:Transcript_12285/g.29341  ORF Transcript_12285/g.29341 Transcript_12285/m.29341 type:complete len:164 (-) Transcript_12285:1270-1761(-)